MVTKRPLNESVVSMNKSNLALDLNLPAFETFQVEHWPSPMSWSDAIRHFAATRERYMREVDSPEARWRNKNPQPFRLP